VILYSAPLLQPEVVVVALVVVNQVEALAEQMVVLVAVVEQIAELVEQEIPHQHHHHKEVMVATEVVAHLIMDVVAAVVLEQQGQTERQPLEETAATGLHPQFLVLL
jgi:hypothetical protein